MKNKIEIIRKSSLIELQTWAGLSPTPGVTGTIVTKDFKLYHYHQYNRIPESLKDKISLEGLSEGIQLNEKTKNKLINYIEKNILNNTYKDQFIFDASFHVIVNYNGKKVTINNYPEINSEINKILERGE